MAIKFRNFTGSLNYLICVVFVTRAPLLDRCNSRAMQAVFKKLTTKLLESGAITGIINALLYGLTHNTCEHFALCSCFSLPPWNSDKILRN